MANTFGITSVTELGHVVGANGNVHATYLVVGTIKNGDGGIDYNDLFGASGGLPAQMKPVSVEIQTPGTTALKWAATPIFFLNPAATGANPFWGFLKKDGATAEAVTTVANTVATGLVVEAVGPIAV